MNTRSPHDDAFEPLEALIRGAGDYLEVCGDLRPRVIEAARDERRDRRATRLVMALAACLIGVGALWESATQTIPVISPLLERDLLSVTDSEELLETAAEIDSTGEWGVVEIFCRLQERRGEVLRDGAT